MSAIQASRALTIAFFVEGMYASGVDTSTRLLADALRAQGHRVVTFLPWKERCLGGNDDLVLLPSVRVNSKQAVYLSYPVSLRLFNLFNEISFDLIHVHTSTSVNLLAWQMSKLFHLPIVYTYHTMTKEYMHYYVRSLPGTVEPWLTTLVEKFDRIICNRADAVVAPSAKAAAYLATIAITPPVNIIPNGINLARFYPWPADLLQARFGVPQDAKVLLWIGRLNQEKRPLLAYELFRRLAAQRPDVVLVMVGDGALRSELEARCRLDELEGRFFLTGLVDHAEMPAIYNSADLWLSTSQSEVHPMVAIEATACALPAIAWRDRALEGIVVDGDNGFLIDTIEDGLAALNRVLDDGELYQQLCAATVQTRSMFDIEATATQMADLYRTLCHPYQHRRQYHQPFRPLRHRVS